MARGRMIANQICRDKKIHELSDDTSRLAFTWLITFADVEGRTYGDPAIVRSMVFPRRSDVTVNEMDTYIQEWCDAGLIVRYEAAGDLFIWFPAFEKNQPGLRKDREQDSIIPPPPSDIEPEPPQQQAAPTPDDCRSESGVTPEQIPVKLIKEKLIKKNQGAKTAPQAQNSPHPEDLAYYKLQEKLLSLTGLPVPKPVGANGWSEFKTLWMAPGKSILSWVNYDEQKASVLVEDAVRRMQKERLTIANFKSIVKIASAAYGERNGHN